MIKDVPCYTVICDNCGKDSNKNSEHVCWTDKEAAEDIASSANWHTEGDKHYCPDCYEFDEADTVLIKTIKSV